MIYVLTNLGFQNLRHLQFIRLDHNLIQALVERWCPLTNTFHFTIGEMTITLQDVQILLGLRIDGPAVVGDTVYHDPNDEEDVATFRMGSSQIDSMLPLRWLRWTFYRESYDELAPEIFLRHVRAYILFMIDCFLIPDTSRSHVSLQWLPLLADVESFNRMSIGGAVLGHLYRELCYATRPTRTYIAGCVALLQVWYWERLYIDRIRELPAGNTMTYRDEFDGLRMSQVIMTPYTHTVLAALPLQYHDGEEIWRARVPLISWKRAEWHLPDRVVRQFSGLPTTEIEPMDQSFRRIDGRGRADQDWTVQYRDYLQIWEERRAYVVPIIPVTGSGNQEVGAYLRWYRSWASIYLLQPQVEPPETFFPRLPGERLVVRIEM
ncbi:Serine/threonine-protein phosphatase 7 long form like [Dendrobium catenatum]|uniref:Serine/threonine-protein phosphatase 7 long form like n=1 Tax=Dendrobium catenatum TaxID=906689 RepID=A0A2I0VQ67_9ASPA|nr:Serine/threonine-protein phosphatase 7 long form like [Dendrobium catenatum]